MKVKIKEDINLKDLNDKKWCGSRNWTLDFLKMHYGYILPDKFDVEPYDRDLYKIKNNGVDEDLENDDIILLPKMIFEKLEQPIKEMTVAEISEALGYEVKVIREDK